MLWCCTYVALLGYTQCLLPIELDVTHDSTNKSRGASIFLLWGFYFAAKVIVLPRPVHGSIVMDYEVSIGPLEVLFVL